jgi:hypothetical protein
MESSPEGALSAREEFLKEWATAHRASAALEVDRGVQPYPGLRAFTPNEADLFFGRDGQVEDLRTLLSSRNVIVVLGGSGSGKSSLVRAGLVPQLKTTLPIQGRPGAWYVVEFRPRIDPASELLEALLQQIIEPVLNDAAEQLAGDQETVTQHALVEEKAHALAEDRGRRYRALSKAFGIESFAPDVEIGVVRTACRKRLKDVLFEGDVIDIGALFDFAEEGLVELDRVLSDGNRSGDANLLLLIDQFEEVFKPSVSKPGRDMIMSLLTSVHNYKPRNMILIITMRSEELHRCSEFLGVAEVINGSLYLVDLIGGRNIDQAIVGPTRRVLKSWDLPTGHPQRGPFTQRALSKLHSVFDDARTTLPHPADQLPLIQHLLPLIWDKAIERWEKADPSKPLNIDLDVLESVPGWIGREGPLVSCLNAHAEEVLRRGVERAQAVATRLDFDSISQIVQIAFCCLAQQDDRGNVVRDFANIDSMLADSGVAERSPPGQAQDCRNALATALAEFQKGTLIGVKGETYDVNHEAFIRGWKTYRLWLAEVRQQQERLVAVDRQLRAETGRRERGSRLLSVLDEAFNARRLWAANQIAGDETAAALQYVVGPNRTFSTHWARRMLPAVPDSDGSDVGRRIGAVVAAVRDAGRYRAHIWNQYRSIFVAGIMFFSTATAVQLIYYRQQIFLAKQAVTEKVLQTEASLAKAREAEVAVVREQFRVLRTATSAMDRVEVGRIPWQDIEAAGALKRASSQYNPAHGLKDEALLLLQTTLQQLDAGAREVLSDLSFRIAEPSDLAKAKKANCVDPNNADDAKKGLVASARPGFSYRPIRPDLRAVWLPFWRNSQIFPNETDYWSEGTIVCLSHDANWLLIWYAKPGNVPNGPPIVRRIVWSNGDLKVDASPWRVQIGPRRRLGALENGNEYNRLLKDSFASLRSGLKEGRVEIRSFQRDQQVGFLVPFKDPDGKEQIAMLWTVTGLSDPEDRTDEGSPKLVPCQAPGGQPTDDSSIYVETSVENSQRKQMRCDVDSVHIKGILHKLVLTYFKPEPGDPPQEGESVPRCSNAKVLCDTNIALQFPPFDSKTVRMNIRHLSNPIASAAIDGGFLWLQDQAGQVWRYVIDPDKVIPLFHERWKSVDWKKYPKIEYTDACERWECWKGLSDLPERKKDSSQGPEETKQ